jgi:hypothetical protein
MTRTSTEFPRLEPESSASTNSAMAAYLSRHLTEFQHFSAILLWVVWYAGRPGMNFEIK